MDKTREVERLASEERLPEGPACRVEIKENSKGEPYIGGIKATNEATSEDATRAVELALSMYKAARAGLS